MKLNRYQAFGGHLLGSIMVALCITALVFLVWYPAPLAEATGVTQIFLLLLAVDVIVGPCITLIIFNPAKKELKYDMAIILLLQIAAMLYGLHAVFVARPVYLVYNVGRFDLVYANDLTEDKLNKVTNPEFKSIPLWGPNTIAARQPTDAKIRETILFSALAGGDDLAQLPEYYVPYDNEKAQVIKHLRTIDQLLTLNWKSAQDIDALSQRYAGQKAGIGFLPMKVKHKDLSVIVAKDSAEVLEIANLKPW